MTVPARRTSRTLLGGLLGAGLAVVFFAVVTVLLATGRPDPAKVAGRTPVQSTCAKALLRDWADGRIDATYRLECYRAALKSLPADLQVYSRAPEDILQALSQRIVQSRPKRLPRRNTARPRRAAKLIERGVHMPESGLPIRVYKEHDMWRVDYGEGVIEDHTSEEEATSAADAVAEAEERTVVVEE